MATFLNRLTSPKDTTKRLAAASRQRKGEQYPIVSTTYTSKDVEVPDTFLKEAPPDAQPILTHPIRFEDTPLPEYEGFYAVVLDNVLSPSECKQLVEYAEMSAGSGDEGVENNGWRQAMVNAGPGKEFTMLEYRNSDRIIWDNQELVDRIWERCLEAEGIREDLSRIEGRLYLQGPSAVNRGEKWSVTRLNERMRFLRYGPGQFFKEHCDGFYKNPCKEEKSFITLHLYLNDSVQALIPSTSQCSASFPDPLPKDEPMYLSSEPLQGGATPFHSRDMKRRIDVNPRAGRILLFQHKDLIHSGDYVTSGVKYTMRTDLMYERTFD